MLGPESPEAVSPDRALCLPIFSHLLIVNKLISLSLSLSLSHPNCAPGNQPHPRALHCLHCRSSGVSPGDDLRLDHRASCCKCLGAFRMLT